MPFKSQAQAKFFFASAAKKGGLPGLKQNTAKNFIQDTEHQKIGNLPEYAPKQPKFPSIKKAWKVKS